MKQGHIDGENDAKKHDVCRRGEERNSGDVFVGERERERWFLPELSAMGEWMSIGGGRGEIGCIFPRQ